MPAGVSKFLTTSARARIISEDWKTMAGFDLGKYFALFGDALEERYNRKDRFKEFKDGFARIETHYRELRPGPHRRDITARDVLEIFADDLPYVDDWSKPDYDDLAKRMERTHVADLIRRLTSDSYSKRLLSQIRYCFRDLGLTALVLHHIYPERYAMCSHHLASLLFVSGRTVPEFYVDYCEELLWWSRWEPLRRPELNVAETEFALWTWYWFAHRPGGNSDDRRKHFRAFSTDPSVRARRADRIAHALRGIDKLDLANSYLKTEPTVAAIIAWRELERELRRILGHSGKMGDLIPMIESLKPSALPADWTGQDLSRLWSRTGPGRDQVMHVGSEVEPDDAEIVVNSVRSFVEHNRTG